LRQQAYLAPSVEQPDGLFLKTNIQNRKATRDYLRRSVLTKIHAESKINAAKKAGRESRLLKHL
jgi:hypothetical protein